MYVYNIYCDVYAHVGLAHIRARAIAKQKQAQTVESEGKEEVEEEEEGKEKDEEEGREEDEVTDIRAPGVTGGGNGKPQKRGKELNGKDSMSNASGEVEEGQRVLLDAEVNSITAILHTSCI